MDIKKEAIELHEKLKGKIEIRPKAEISREVLRLLYTPGVAEIVRIIARNKPDVYRYTGKGNSIAIVSDGSRILGLGNLGPEAALPVMESKAMLYKAYGNVDAYPVCLKTQKTEEIISIVENISPNFGAINIEDIEAPKCFEIVEKLSERLDIPVFHDDQHGTAIIVTAGLMNALKIVNKSMETARIVILGSGAAGYGIAKLLVHAGARNLLVLDSNGIIHRKRDSLNKYKQELAEITNQRQESGTLEDAIQGSDVFIGVSGRKGIVSGNMVKDMNKDAIVFALSNPDPEIMPADAKAAEARIVATGRGDFENQINNSLVFPFFMRKVLDERIMKIDKQLMYLTAEKISGMVAPAPDRILPSIEEVRPL
ncbi:MAG: NADP-dependent malic enzyme [Candidatus Aenigmarchaeota archaeon]|nr:NADP-dependent malic enzyme [Candidatus Aenigmarchaeota archaeon]